MVEAVENPGEERVHLEEGTFLAELVQLGISVEQASRDELVDYAHCEWRKDGKKDIVEG